MKRITILKFLLISIAFLFCQFVFAGDKHDVLEVVIFSKKPSYTRAQVIKKAGSVTPILKSYPGFLSRQFAENTKANNQWVDIVHWASLHDALAAANKIVRTTQMKKFMSVMSSCKMYHFQTTFSATKSFHDGKRAK